MCIRWKKAGRLAGFLLLLVMLLTLGPSGADAGPGAVTSIGSAGELLAFAESVNEGESYAGRTVKLTANIDLAGQAFAPIGRPELGLAHIFQGTFDGGGHAISGLAVTGGSSGSAGLFAELYNATVQNLALSGTVAANGPGAVGALAGWMVNATVRGVLISAQVTGARWATPEDGCAAVGVVAGKATGRTVMDRVGAQGGAGGAGAFRWAVYVGGFIGYVQGGGSITNCYTTATAYCNDAGVYVGGFFGGAVSPPTVKDSYAAAFVHGGRATSGAFAGYCDGAGRCAANTWYDRDLAGSLAGVAAPADSPLNEALQRESTALMQDSVFPSRLSGAFAQAGPDQNRGYPVFLYETPQPQPTAVPAPTDTPEPSPTPSDAPEPSPDPSDTPEPTPEPTSTSEPTPEPTSTPEPAPTPSGAPEPSPDPSDAPEPSPEPSDAPEPAPTPSDTPEPSPAPTDTPEPSPDPSNTPEPSPDPSNTPEPSPTPSDAPEPSPTPSDTPEPSPTPSGTPEPSPDPSGTPEPSPEAARAGVSPSEPAGPTPTAPSPTPDPTAPASLAADPTGTPAVPPAGPAAAVPVQPPGSPYGLPCAPQTGDETVILPWLAMLALCFAALAWAAVHRRGPF